MVANRVLGGCWTWYWTGLFAFEGGARISFNMLEELNRVRNINTTSSAFEPTPKITERMLLVRMHI